MTSGCLGPVLWSHQTISRRGRAVICASAEIRAPGSELEEQAEGWIRHGRFSPYLWRRAPQGHAGREWAAGCPSLGEKPRFPPPPVARVSRGDSLLPSSPSAHPDGVRGSGQCPRQVFTNGYEYLCTIANLRIMSPLFFYLAQSSFLGKSLVLTQWGLWAH